MKLKEKLFPNSDKIISLKNRKKGPLKTQKKLHCKTLMRALLKKRKERLFLKNDKKISPKNLKKAFFNEPHEKHS